MTQKIKRKNLWVAVKVERGYVTRAKIFDSLAETKATERRWRSRLNPDYDEVAIVRAS